MRSVAFIFLLFITSFPHYIFAQGWDRSNSMTGYDYGAGVVQTADGGYLTAYSHSYEYGDSKILKYDWDGVLLWSNFYPNTHIFHIGEDMTNNGFVIMGITNLPVPKPTVFFRTDSLGNIASMDSFPLMYWWNYGDFFINQAGNYVMAGTRPLNGPPFPCPSPPATVAVYDSTGNLLLSNVFGDTICPISQWGYFLEVNELSTGGMLAVGTLRDTITFTTYSPLATKMNSSGNIIWTKYFPGLYGTITDFVEIPGDRIALWMCNENMANPPMIIIDTAGNIVSVPNVQTGGGDTMDKIYYNPANNWFTVITSGIGVMRFDSTFNFGDFHSYPGELWWATHVDSRKTSSGEYIITGHRMDTLANGDDFCIFKVDTAGRMHSNRITGTVFYDSISNCIVDPLDPLFNYCIVEAQGNFGPFYSITDVAGNYSLPADTGVYTVLHYPVNAYRLPACPSPSGTYSINATTFSTVFPNRDFGDTLVPNVQDLRAGLSIYWPIPQGSFCPTIIYTNDGTIPVSGTVKLLMDDSVNFQASIPPPSFTILDTLYWNFSNLQPLQSQIIDLCGTVTSLTPFGWPLITQLWILPQSGDFTPANNYINRSDTNQLPYDPNVKIVDPKGGGPTGLISASQELTYTIHFQNTGNDTAMDVVARDSVSANLDLATFKFVSSSHPVVLNVTDGRTLKFTFSNILLPDSNVNEPASHGFVSFRMKPVSSVQPGQQILNTCYIYFDYNVPVQTNTTLNTIELLISVNSVSAGQQLLLHPNPVHVGEPLYFYKQSNGELREVSVFDLQGRTILKKMIKGNSILIPELTEGIYFIEVRDEKSVSFTAKFIVIRN